MDSSGVRFFPRGALPLETDHTGARFWGVALSKTLLTYFEAPPGTRFETHRHESEQITLVLDGTLHFEVDGRTIAVAAGEVIAIPSNVPHAVFTGAEAARAVDAWSPVMERYRS